jgi:hypothetical protein
MLLMDAPVKPAHAPIKDNRVEPASLVRAF